MTASYYTLVQRGVLAQIVNGTAEMPKGFRLVRVVEAPTPDHVELVEFDDDGAPEWMNGCRITPSFSVDYDPDTGEQQRIWISDRHLEALPVTARLTIQPDRAYHPGSSERSAGGMTEEQA